MVFKLVMAASKTRRRLITHHPNSRMALCQPTARFSPREWGRV
jgi:hypothetical protein